MYGFVHQLKILGNANLAIGDNVPALSSCARKMRKFQ